MCCRLFTVIYLPETASRSCGISDRYDDGKKLAGERNGV
jgi:hypothetical protein